MIIHGFAARVVFFYPINTFFPPGIRGFCKVFFPLHALPVRIYANTNPSYKPGKSRRKCGKRLTAYQKNNINLEFIFKCTCFFRGIFRGKMFCFISFWQINKYFGSVLCICFTMVHGGILYKTADLIFKPVPEKMKNP